MAKRYRSLRREQRMLGGKILFAGHLFPPEGHPPCDDPRLIEHIESRAGFGTLFFVLNEDEKEIVINPESIPEGVSGASMSAALKNLQKMGIDVNPAFLAEAEKTTEPPPETPAPPPEGEHDDHEINTLPTLTFVRKANKEDLQRTIKVNGWEDIDLNGHNVYLRDAIREKIEAHQTQ